MASRINKNIILIIKIKNIIIIIYNSHITKRIFFIMMNKLTSKIKIIFNLMILTLILMINQSNFKNKESIENLRIKNTKIWNKKISKIPILITIITIILILINKIIPILENNQIKIKSIIITF